MQVCTTQILNKYFRRTTRISNVQHFGFVMASETGDAGSEVLNIETLVISLLQFLPTRNVFANRRVCKWWRKLCSNVNVWFKGECFDALGENINCFINSHSKPAFCEKFFRLSKSEKPQKQKEGNSNPMDDLSSILGFVISERIETFVENPNVIKSNMGRKDFNFTKFQFGQKKSKF